ncbi:hypothetical protein ACFXPV_10725 [Streptomyces sp. NPDC059118]|uniref:MmyB family transcriptional regulator n=1 Tax=unclassified Streptomyces TaxID=2593676 RepID=UPI00367B8FD1
MLTVRACTRCCSRSPSGARSSYDCGHGTAHGTAHGKAHGAARHDARRKRLRSKRFRHPDVGELPLHIQALGVRSAPGHELVVHHAEPDSPNAEALALPATRAG